MLVDKEEARRFVSLLVFARFYLDAHDDFLFLVQHRECKECVLARLLSVISIEGLPSADHISVPQSCERLVHSCPGRSRQ